MNDNPKVSIIIPVYNGANFIREAIESALEQTYKNIEIIVVNDGSIDETETIVLSYGKKIKYYKKENGGVASALNLGIKNMKGEYFSWLSHDDKYLKIKLETQIKYLMSNKLLDKKIILFSDYSIIDNKSRLLFNRVINHKEMEEKPEYALLRSAINGLTLLIPKKAFTEIGLFKEELKTVQDYELWHRMMKKYKFIHMEKILVETRIHPNQVSNTSNNIVSEGNNLWINMIKSITNKKMIKLEGSVDNFYYEMYKHLIKTPYVGALKFVENEYKTKTNKSIKLDKTFLRENGLYSSNPILRAYEIMKYEGFRNMLKRAKNKLFRRQK